MNKLIDTILKLGVLLVLITATTSMHEFSYYTFVRWVVLVSSIYFVYRSYDRKQIGLVIYFFSIAILFNPFKPFWFQKETWHLIDYLITAIIGATLILDWTISNKTERDDN